MPETFIKADTAKSNEPTTAPWNIAFKTEKPLFVWYDDKENEWRKSRFSAALAGTVKMEPHDAILSGKSYLTSYLDSFLDQVLT